MNQCHRFHTTCFLSPDNPLALHNVGAHYFSGQGVKQDMKKAVEFYEKASMLGFPPAQVTMHVSKNKYQLVNSDSIYNRVASFQQHIQAGTAFVFSVVVTTVCIWALVCQGAANCTLQNHAEKW